MFMWFIYSLLNYDVYLWPYARGGFHFISGNLLSLRLYRKNMSMEADCYISDWRLVSLKSWRLVSLSSWSTMSSFIRCSSDSGLVISSYSRGLLPNITSLRASNSEIYSSYCVWLAKSWFYLPQRTQCRSQGSPFWFGAVLGSIHL